MTNYRQSVVQFAQQQIGKPYVWGATGPNGYDCSGLVFAAYKAAGLDLPRTTAENLGKQGTAVDQAHAQPGDVVYYNEPGSTDHVGIYVGSGRMIDAPTEGKSVEVDDINSFGTVTSIRQLPQLAGSSTPSWLPGWLDSTLTALSGQAVGNAVGVKGASVGGEAQTAADLANPFGDWQTSALAIGLKVAAVAVCGGLLIVGAKQTVNSGA